LNQLNFGLLMKLINYWLNYLNMYHIKTYLANGRFDLAEYQKAIEVVRKLAHIYEELAMRLNLRIFVI
jgi:hypothetical protein